MALGDVVVVEGIPTTWGNAGEREFSVFTCADDIAVRVIRKVLRRNPRIQPEMAEERV